MRSQPTRTLRPRHSCLNIIVILGGVVVLVLACYALVLRPRISRYVGEQIGAQLAGGQPQPGDAQGLIEERTGQALPDIVAALPPGEIVVTEQDANEYLVAHRNDFAPIEQLTVQFVPGEIQATLQASGVSSRGTLGLEIRDGQVAMINPRIEGPLAVVISAEELSQSIARQLNEQLAAQGKRATDVRVEQGRVVIRIEN